MVGSVGRGRNGVIVDTRNDCRENVWLKAACVEQVVLEELTRFVRLRKCPHRVIGMWPPRLQAEPLPQRRGQVSDIPAVQHELLVGVQGGMEIQFLILCMSGK